MDALAVSAATKYVPTSEKLIVFPSTSNGPATRLPVASKTDKLA